MSNAPARKVVPPALMVIPASAARGLELDGQERFQFHVRRHWAGPSGPTPHAREAEREVLAWFGSLGCSAAELRRAARCDVAGFLALAFPLHGREEAIRVARYICLWLLWDDVHVERLEHRWRLRAGDVLSGTRPPGMTRFDEGWWQLFGDLASRRSAGWLSELCDAMAAWNDAAVEEAHWTERYQRTGVRPRFEEHLRMRIATIGMYPTLYLFEDAFGHELPRGFHEHPTVRRLKLLANQIVGLGNDILSFGKDLAERQVNLVSTFMADHGVDAPEALSRLIGMHDASLEEFDQLAGVMPQVPVDAAPCVGRWLNGVRHASLGFGLWEAQAPRYTEHQLVWEGRVIRPTFRFID
jgi:hypothetical protein